MALSGEKFDGDNLKVSYNAALMETVLLREVVISTKKEMYDKTGASEKARRKHGGKYEHTCRITAWGSNEDADLRSDFDETETAPKAVIVYPNGNTTGEPTRTFNAWFDSIEETIPHDGMVAYVINLTIDGGITKGTAP